MRIEAVKYAVQQFQELRRELAPCQALVGGNVTALVRQRHHDTDRGWALSDIGFSPDETTLWGRFIDVDPKGRRKNVLIVIDTDSIDSIEFETFDQVTAPSPKTS